MNISRNVNMTQYHYVTCRMLMYQGLAKYLENTGVSMRHNVR